MAQKYLNSQEAADALGVSVDEVRRMIESRELYGYRDGADWKFKVEDIERKAHDMSGAAGGDDVLLSETELGGSSADAAGTVIGMSDKPVHDSDLHLSGSDVHLAEPLGTPGSSALKFEELDLTLDEDLTLDDSSPKPRTGKAGDSALNLGSASKHDDDELVLGGGSGMGSDITLGGDSGISLVDPTDSGLSLEQPLDLGEESLELGEDDMLNLAVESSGVKMKGDDEFLLTPLDEPIDPEESESGSQVIALDTDGDDAGAMVGGMPSGGMAAMLEEDVGALSGGMDGVGAPLGGAITYSDAVADETPYSALMITSLVGCSLLLMVCGMFMFDLVRNMWTWDSTYSVNSSMMDTILGLFG